MITEKGKIVIAYMILVFVQIGLLLAKLCGLTWPWVIILIPAWIFLAVFLFFLIGFIIVFRGDKK